MLGLILFGCFFWVSILFFYGILSFSRHLNNSLEMLNQIYFGGFLITRFICLMH
jgi:hypothetical protein